jgi:hypothetical protein
MYGANGTVIEKGKHHETGIHLHFDFNVHSCSGGGVPQRLQAIAKKGCA